MIALIAVLQFFYPPTLRVFVISEDNYEDFQSINYSLACKLGNIQNCKSYLIFNTVKNIELELLNNISEKNFIPNFININSFSLVNFKINFDAVKGIMPVIKDINNFNVRYLIFNYSIQYRLIRLITHLVISLLTFYIFHFKFKV